MVKDVDVDLLTGREMEQGMMLRKERGSWKINCEETGWQVGLFVESDYMFRIGEFNGEGVGSKGNGGTTGK